MSNVNVAHLGLAIDSPLIAPGAANFRPPSWPPEPDFPVVIDADGNVISRYGDQSWDLSVWAGQRVTINFGDGPDGNSPPIDAKNAALLRQIVAWWLYGPRAVQTPGTLLFRFVYLRPIFALCSQEGILASELMRFPAVADKLSACLPRATAHHAFVMLHVLFEQRHELGFTLLDRDGLSRLESDLPEHETRQTPYIPPRIWTYQHQRLRAFLEDFLAHRQGFEDCFVFLRDAYAWNYGSLAAACAVGRDGKLHPFNPDLARPVHSRPPHARFAGTFAQIMQRFGLLDFMVRWFQRDAANLDAQILASCFTAVDTAGLAYILNYSLMRVGEAVKLRSDALESERDDRFGMLYMLRGETTKTVQDDDALWVVAPEVRLAVDAMALVSRLRMTCAKEMPEAGVSPEDERNPYLFLSAYEPWSAGLVVPMNVRPSTRHYGELAERVPGLFDMAELRITEADLQVARLVNPDLDGEVFVVGAIWPLAWHQLRRTGAVNMQASGLVSDASLQYQLKHATRSMSLYYGQGYSTRALNREAREMYIRTMYEVIGKELVRLFSDRFVSPHGEKRKLQVLQIVSQKDFKELSRLSKQGKVASRETLFGLCMKKGPCEFGGIDNPAHCAGTDAEDGKPCPDALWDREKEPQIQAAKEMIEERIAEAEAGTPLWHSLQAQRAAAEAALATIAAST